MNSYKEIIIPKSKRLKSRKRKKSRKKKARGKGVIWATAKVANKPGPSSKIRLSKSSIVYDDNYEPIYKPKYEANYEPIPTKDDKIAYNITLLEALLGSDTVNRAATSAKKNIRDWYTEQEKNIVKTRIVKPIFDKAEKTDDNYKFHKFIRDNEPSIAQKSMMRIAKFAPLSPNVILVNLDNIKITDTKTFKEKIKELYEDPNFK